MSDEVQRGTLMATTADRLSATFARELSVVLKATERRLLPILRAALSGDRTAQVTGSVGLAHRAALRDALRTSGFDALANAATARTVDQMATAVLATRIGTGTTALVPPNPLKLHALNELARSNLLGLAETLSADLWRGVTAWAFSARSVDEVFASLAVTLDDAIPQFRTLFDTQASMIGRQIEALATADLPDDQPFLYVGPLDEVTRPFCEEWAGQVLTRDEIDALDNGQLPNVFLTGGGYNCRHSWLAVASEELADLSGTGRRAPEYEEAEA